MVRTVSNRRVGPKNKEHPTGKHKSLLQDITYFESIDQPMTEAERAKMNNEFARMRAITKPFDLPTLLEKYRFLTIQYLENSKYDHTKCENWEWGFTLTNEYKAAAQLDGGFKAAFSILNTIGHIESKLKKGDMEKAIAFSLHLGLYTRSLVIAELEPLYHAADLKIKAVNQDKSQVTKKTIEMARPVFQSYLDKGQSKANAGKLTSKYLMEKHGISKSHNTVRQWF